MKLCSGIRNATNTNLKSWAVYSSSLRRQSEFSKWNVHRFGTSPHFRLEMWTGAPRLPFLGVRNPKQITSFFLAVPICPVVSGRCRGGVRMCPGRPPCRVATRHPILWILSGSAFPIASALDVPGLGHDETQKPGVSLAVCWTPRPGPRRKTPRPGLGRRTRCHDKIPPI